jgi:formylglycine-generating enzyme required for sulfatase activity
MTGRPYRLPSEAEWEYACRAGTTTDYHFGPSIATEVANYNGESPFGSGVARKQTLPVGGVGVANPLGLYDMSGNVQEWCLDAWHDDYRAAPADAKAWGADSRELRRVARGGSWLQNGSSSRCASRVGAMARSWSNTTGFRVAVGAAPY